MKIRVFASLRQVVGGPVIEVDGDTVRDLLDAATRAYGPRLGDQFPHCKIVVNGEPLTDLDTRVSDADEIAILPPVAGGDYRWQDAQK